MDTESKGSNLFEPPLWEKIRENTENAQEKQEEEKEIIITHPSYEIHEDFLNLGFREIRVENDILIERNLYIISHDTTYMINHEKTLTLNGKKLFFNTKDRLLINIEEKWDKKRLLDFLNNPESPVNLYQEIKLLLKGYIEFQKEAFYGLVTAWIIASYFHRCFHAMCFLFFYGKKQSGKSRALDLLERLAFNAIKVKGISVASLADSIDGVRGTFINDQAESLSNPKNDEILGILTDSYTIGGGKRRIVQIIKQERRSIEFETYSPKVFASIKDVDTDLKDRCIYIPMVRATRDYPYPEAHLPVWGEVRDKLYRFLLTRWKEAKEIYTRTGEGVTQRVKELWRPIETILILENVAQDEQKAIKELFLESMEETQTELTEYEHELFDALMRLLDEEKERKLTISEIAQEINRERANDVTEEEQVKDAKREKGQQTWIGKTIIQLSLYSKRTERIKNKRSYLFNYNHVHEIYRRYTGNKGTEQTNNTIDCHLMPPPKNEVAFPKSLIEKPVSCLATNIPEKTSNKKDTTKNTKICNLCGKEAERYCFGQNKNEKYVWDWWCLTCMPY